MSPIPGRFITLEGGEAAGKSTQIHFLQRYLTCHGLEVITTREPGGTAGAERVRSLLKKGSSDLWDGLSEALLLYAARRDHVEKVIKPALSAGKWVISDRFADSTRVYQVHGRGIDAMKIETLHRLALDDFEPDITFILDTPPILGLNRAKKRAERQGLGGERDRFERMDLAFHERIYKGFHLLGVTYKRCVLVDGTIPIPQVSYRLAEILYERFSLPLREEVFNDTFA